MSGIGNQPSGPPVDATAPEDTRVKEILNSFVNGASREGLLRILVLGDITGSQAASLRALGHDVTHSPGRQRPKASPLPARTPEERPAKTLDTSQLTRRDEDFDVMVADEGWYRITETLSSASLTELVAWLRTHVRLCIIPATRQTIDHPTNALGPWRVIRQLQSFRFITEWPDDLREGEAPPLLLASDELVFTGHAWISAHRVRAIDGPRGLAEPSHAADETRKPKTMLIDDTVMKIEHSSTDYFERSQVAREAAFLNSWLAQESGLGLPALLHHHRGRAVSTLVRTCVPGSATVRGNEPFQRVAAVYRLASSYAEQNLFHNDFRPWNLLWSDEGVHLIDFGDTSQRDADVDGLPQIVALAGTLLALLDMQSSSPAHFTDEVMELLDTSGLLRDVPLASLYEGPWRRLASAGDLGPLDVGLGAPTLFRHLILRFVQHDDGAAPSRGEYG